MSVKQLIVNAIKEQCARIEYHFGPMLDRYDQSPDELKIILDRVKRNLAGLACAVASLESYYNSCVCVGNEEAPLFYAILEHCKSILGEVGADRGAALRF